mgnify:FL=1
MKKILVYGASGDQGIPLVNSLLNKGYSVRAVTRNPDEYKPEVDGEVEAVKADLFDINSLLAASEGIDGIAMNIPFVFDKIIAEKWGKNITSAGSQMGVKKIVFNTSCYVAPNDNGLAAHDGRRAIEKCMEELSLIHI